MSRVAPHVLRAMSTGAAVKGSIGVFLPHAEATSSVPSTTALDFVKRFD